jgi:site-specific recombinase XerD
MHPPRASARLRHTYGTRLAAAGVSARNIPELIGHEDLETSAIYIHLINGAQDSAVAELEAFDQVATAGTAARVPAVAL